MVLDGGDLLFREVSLRGRQDSAALKEKARLLARVAVEMGVAAVNVGRRDLAAGIEFVVRLGSEPGVPWVASNLRTTEGSHPLPRWRTAEWAGKRWVVLGLLPPNPALDGSLGVQIQPPAEAVREVLEGAAPFDRVAVLSNLGLDAEKRLAAEFPGISLIVGGGTNHSFPLPPVVGDTILLRAGDRGRYVGILDLTEGPLRSWARPVNRQERLVVEQRLRADRQRFAALDGTDGTEEERAAVARALQGQISAGEAALRRFEEAGVLFTHRLEALSASVGEDAEVAAWVREYKEQTRRPVSAPSRAGSTARPPAPGGPFYTGSAACRSCHDEAYRAWLGTSHARAYAALGSNNRDPSCLGCHATRLRRASGLSLEPVVGCETCHGPGGNHRTSANIARRPGPAVCGGCHRGHHPEEAFEHRRAYEGIRCDQDQPER